ncbi:hypothetical protein DL96DRAFT_1712268 [Flagelloscypha sp. PMI_526]|nr:hypothetical protein DL96DRAFT_1712268 [Flagelloscypha sp. PMI_526]
MSPRFGTLSDLPYDIVCRVFSFCTPVTVIRARQCSHALEHVSRDVSLWLGILDRFCLDLGLPRCALLPGYSPLASLYDLERITLGHIALHNRLTAKHSCQTLDAAAVRFIPNSTGSKPEAVKLVSGGRFLVSVASTKIHLWDLGHCALSLSLNPRLVAHHPINIPWEGLQHDQVRIVLSNCSWIGSILQVPIELESDIHNQTAMCTFGLDLGSTNPEFMLVAEIKFESWLVFSPFVDGRVSFFFEGDEHALGVYDFKTGLGVKWYSPQRFNMTDLVASKPELLLAMNSSKMLLSTFKVPLHFAQLRDYKRDSQGFVVIENPTLVTAPWNCYSHLLSVHPNQGFPPAAPSG